MTDLHKKSIIILTDNFLLIFLKLVDNTLLGLRIPFPPLAPIDGKDVLIDDTLQLLQSLLLVLELYFLGDFGLAVIGLEGQVTQVQAEGWGQGHVELVVEEGVSDEGWVVVAHEYLDNAAYYLADLVVYETLPLYHEF